MNSSIGREACETLVAILEDAGETWILLFGIIDSKIRKSRIERRSLTLETFVAFLRIDSEMS